MAHLIVMSGDLKGRKFYIEQKETTIGRSSDNTIALSAPAISGKHCCIIKDGHKYTVKDLGSTNGTRLNNKIIKEEIRLAPKDIIMVGAAELMVNGSEIEIDKSASSSTGLFEVSAEESSVSQKSSATPAAFEKKRNTKIMWIIVFILTGLLAITALSWFIYKLFA
ncbi:FHA domain-containing protein [Verrucomicrobiota bacterium]